MNGIQENLQERSIKQGWLAKKMESPMRKLIITTITAPDQVKETFTKYQKYQN